MPNAKSGISADPRAIVREDETKGLAPRTIFVGWTESHASAFARLLGQSSEADFFPLNQKAAARWLIDGRKLTLPPFWELCDGTDLLAIDRIAEAFASAWQGRPEWDINRSRAWLWAREAAYLRRLLAALEASLGLRPDYWVPTTCAYPRRNWHGAQGAPIAAFQEMESGGRRIRWLELAATGDSAQDVSPTPCGEPPLDLAGRQWVLVSSFGIPDLIVHVRLILKAVDVTVVLLDDRSDASSSEPFEAGDREFGDRVRRLWLAEGVACPETASPPGGTGHLGRMILETGLNPERILRQLDALLELRPIACVVSDHDCPQTAVLSSLCARAHVPIKVIPHSAWPMEGTFSAIPRAAFDGAECFASTQRAARQLGLQTTSRVSDRPITSPRYLPALSRTLRSIRRMMSSREASVLRLGVVVTSGEELSAPDVPIVDIATSLRALLAFAARRSPGLVIHVRLRADEDRQAILEALCEVSGCAVVWELSTDSSPLRFLRKVDLVVEIGSPGSITLESFAEMVPFFRMGATGTRRHGFLLPEVLVPRIDAQDPELRLGPYVASRWRRHWLAWKQFGFLIQDTRRGGGSCLQR